MRLINEIIIHCSATHPEWWAGETTQKILEEFRRWHLDRGMNDVAYHRIIGRNGSTAEGRPLSKTGAHVKGHNSNSLGVCLVGGTPTGKATDKFTDHFTPEQNVALRNTLREWRDIIPNVVRVTGHNEYANKGCPAFTVADWLSSPELSKPIKSSPKWVTAIKKLIELVLNFLRRKK